MQNSWNPSYLPSKSNGIPFYAKTDYSRPQRPLASAAGRVYHSLPTTLPPVEPSASAMLPRDIGSRFGGRLRELRKARNMTQLRMSVDFGIDRSFISDVERGKKSISLILLEVIALGMDLKLSDLLRDL